MINPQEFAQLHANAIQAVGVPTAQKKKKNLLEALLPSVGGIGGAAGGAALGTALLPGIGTIAGGLIGGALGGGGGKVAENAIEGNKLTSGVLGEAATNGILGAGPLRLGKLGIDAIKGVKAGSDLGSVFVSAGQNAVGPSLVKTAVANKLNGTSENLTSKALGLTKGQKNTILDKTGETAGSIAKRNGIQSATDVSAATKPLYNDFSKAVASIPRTFSKNEVSTAFRNVYEPMLKEGVPLGTQTIGNNLKSEAENLLKGINKNISPTELDKKRKAFDQLAYKFKGTDPSAYDVNKMGRNVISDLIHGAADSAGVKTTNGLSLREVGKEINKLERVGKAASKNVEGSGGSSALSLANLPGTVIGGAAGLPGAVAGAAANSALNSGVGRRLVSGVVDKLATRASESAIKNPYGLGSIAKRESVGAAPDLLGALSQSSSSQPTTATNITANTTPSNANMGTLSQNSGDLSSSMPDSSAIQANIQQILSNGGKLSDAATYLGLLKDIQGLSASSSPKLNASQLQQANNANSGLQDIQTISQLLQNDPSIAAKDAIPGGSLARRFTGTTDYEAAKQNIVDVISRLRSGAAITEDEARRYTSLLPGAADTPQSASSKLNRLSNLLSSFANPQAAQPAVSDLASALGN